MFMRTLMTTVAVLALAAPAAAQDKEDITQQSRQQVAQAQQPLQEETAPSGQAEEQAQPAEGEAEQPPAMAEEPAEGEEQPPAMAEEPAEGEEQSPAMAEEPTGEEQIAEPPADMKFIEVQDQAQFLADEEVIGKEVVNVMDEKVGTIADLVMDQEQKLVGVVLSVGGFLGIGDKWVAVSVDQIDFPTDEQPARLLVEVTEEQLRNAPDFVTKQTAQAQQEAEQAQQQMQQGTPPAPTTAQ